MRRESRGGTPPKQISMNIYGKSIKAMDSMLMFHGFPRFFGEILEVERTPPKVLCKPSHRCLLGTWTPFGDRALALRRQPQGDGGPASRRGRASVGSAGHLARVHLMWKVLLAVPSLLLTVRFHDEKRKSVRSIQIDGEPNLIFSDIFRDSFHENSN